MQGILLRTKLLVSEFVDKLRFNNVGAAGKHLKYGQIKGNSLNISADESSGWVASAVIAAQSGKFVYMNAGVVTLCLDGTAQIFGWATHRNETTTVLDKVDGGINIALDAVFRIPVNSGTFVAGMVGDLCDISVSSSVQGAQLDASAENLVIIVGGDLVDNDYVDVKINPVVQGAAVGADA